MREVHPRKPSTVPIDREVLTLEEAAEFLRCDPATVKRRAKVLNLPHRRIGSLWRFYRPSLISWMQQGEPGERAA